MFKKEEFDFPLVKNWRFPFMLHDVQLTNRVNEPWIWQALKNFGVQLRGDDVREDFPPGTKKLCHETRPIPVVIKFISGTFKQNNFSGQTYFFFKFGFSPNLVCQKFGNFFPKANRENTK